METCDPGPWRNIYDNSRWPDNWSDWDGLVFDPRAEMGHDWIEDDAFTPVAFEDQTCCVCGIYRTEVEG